MLTYVRTCVGYELMMLVQTATQVGGGVKFAPFWQTVVPIPLILYPFLHVTVEIVNG